MKLIILAACGLALVASSAPSLAQEEVRREIVNYRDLDLSREQGVAALERRVKRAARRVCQVHGIELWERIQRSACIKRATLDANEQVIRAVSRAREKAVRGNASAAAAAG